MMSTASTREPTMAFALRALHDLAPTLTFSWVEGAYHTRPGPTGRPLLHVQADPRGSSLLRELRTDEDGFFQTRMDGDAWRDEPGCADAEDLALRLVRRHLVALAAADDSARPAMLGMLFALEPGAFAARASTFLRRPVGLDLAAGPTLAAILALPARPSVVS